MNILAAILKYGAPALAGISQVQTEVGASNGDANLQKTKLQIAVAYVLAVAHAGEAVPDPRVQLIATVVELQVSLANSLGLFGKTKTPTTVTVPPPAQQELPLSK